MAAKAGFESAHAYLVQRFETDAPSVNKLAKEFRAWLKENRPEDALPQSEGGYGVDFPSKWFLEQFVLRQIWGHIGEPERDRMEAARKVSHAINAERGWRTGRPTIKPDGTPLPGAEHKARYRAKKRQLLAAAPIDSDSFLDSLRAANRCAIFS